MNTKYTNSFVFLIFLIFFAFLLHWIQWKIQKEDIHLDVELNKSIAEYFYIFSFSIMSGLLLFFGFEKFNYIFAYFLQNSYLAQVLTSTIIVSFSLLYAAYLQDIIENLFDIRIKINEWKNILGYFSGRICVIIIVFLILYYSK
jgi:hypothetical protein